MHEDLDAPLDRSTVHPRHRVCLVTWSAKASEKASIPTNPVDGLFEDPLTKSEASVLSSRASRPIGGWKRDLEANEVCAVRGPEMRS
jgi:hypothetical protein